MKRRYTEVELELMQNIANNLKEILKRKGLTQKDFAEMTGFSTSNVSNIMRAQTLLSPGNLHIASNALNVSKGDIDPTYSRGNVVAESTTGYNVKPKFNPFEIFDLIDKYTDDEIIEKYHHSVGDGILTEQQIRLHLQNVRLIKSLSQ